MIFCCYRAHDTHSKKFVEVSRTCVIPRFVIMDDKTEQMVEIVRLDVLVYHDGYAFASNADMQAKHDRNMKLLKIKLEKDPDDRQCVDQTTRPHPGP